MKTKVILLLGISLLLTVFSFGQKKELKELQKQVDGGDFSNAKTTITKIEPLLGNMDVKSKANFYYLKGKAAAGAGDNATIAELQEATDAYNQVIELEKESGKSKYDILAREGLLQLSNTLVNSAIKDQNSQSYVDAAKKLYLGYKINPKDTSYLYFAAANAVNAKDNDLALTYFEELRDVGYDGAEKKYLATDSKTDEVAEYGTKQERDLLVKAGTHYDPREEWSESRKAEIAKNIILIYLNKNEDEKAIEAIEKAKQITPNDASLMQTEANLYYKLDNVDKYREIMKKVVETNPDNAEVQYNLGVVAGQLGEIEESNTYYKKAIEIDPQYASAYQNLAVNILSEEAKIVDEMNTLGNTKVDNARYEELTQKRKDVYKTAAPYLEKTVAIKPKNVDALRTLMNIYTQLEDPRLSEVQAQLEAAETAASE